MNTEVVATAIGCECVSRDQLCGNSTAVLELTSWLKQWSSKRKNPPKPKPRKFRRGWDSDDDSLDDDLCKLAVLYGKVSLPRKMFVLADASWPKS
jgi:hypothetical protein